MSAVVLRFSRARKRYERQGLLVEEEALRKAEEECLADADLRAARRERGASKRLDDDDALAARMAASIKRRRGKGRVVAAIRHRHNPYDELLMRGLDRTEARHAVRDRVAEMLDRWS